MARKSGLGRGYEALLADNSADDNSAVELRLSEIEPNPEQPRKSFDQEALNELSENIAKYGLLQPIIVRPTPKGNYIIVAGERRWRACRQAGLVKVPVIIKEMSDSQAAEIALIENLQREDLNPVEEANGYKQLMDMFGLTQEDVSKKVGKSRSAVANMLRLLDLGEYLQYLEDGTLSQGHARAMLPLDDEKRRLALVMIKNGATVRQIEALSKEKKKEEKAEKPATVKPTYFSEVELALRQEYGRKVVVCADKTNKKGTLQIEFYGEKDLEELMKSMFNK